MATTLRSQLESLLFVSPKPLSLKRLIELTKAKKVEITACLEEIRKDYEISMNGIQLLESGNEYQFVTSGDNREMVENLVKEELSGELTRPSLETLCIISYRGPITKVELELIRGVNCTLIIRNLLIRGLIEERESRKTATNTYEITLDFLKHLGLTSVTELPDYERLHSHEIMEKFLMKDGGNFQAVMEGGEVSRV
jgi:segregation and condensation protein B